MPTRGGSFSRSRVDFPCNIQTIAASYADIPKLAPPTVDAFSKKIVVYAKSSGKRTREIRITFNFPDEAELPEVNGSIAAEQAGKCRRAV